MIAAVVIILAVAVAALLVVCRWQMQDNRALRRHAMMLTLAWRSPESVALRDLLPGVPIADRRETMRQLLADGLSERIDWGERFTGRRGRMWRYRLSPTGIKELQRRWG